MSENSNLSWILLFSLTILGQTFQKGTDKAADVLNLKRIAYWMPPEGFALLRCRVHGKIFHYKTLAQFLNIAQENKSELLSEMFQVFAGTGSIMVSRHTRKKAQKRWEGVQLPYMELLMDLSSEKELKS